MFYSKRKYYVGRKNCGLLCTYLSRAVPETSVTPRIKPEHWDESLPSTPLKRRNKSLIRRASFVFAKGAGAEVRPPLHFHDLKGDQPPDNGDLIREREKGPRTISCLAATNSLPS